MTATLQPTNERIVELLDRLVRELGEVRSLQADLAAELRRLADAQSA